MYRRKKRGSIQDHIDSLWKDLYDATTGAVSVPYNVVRNELRDYGVDVPKFPSSDDALHWAKENHVGPLDFNSFVRTLKQGKIEFSKRKHPKVERYSGDRPPHLDPVPRDVPEVHVDPAPEEKKPTDINQMSSYTAFNDTRACVDLGGFKCKPKPSGQLPPDRLNWTKYHNQRNGIYTSNANENLWQIMTDSTTANSDPATTGVNAIPDWQDDCIHLNSAFQLDQIFANEGLTYPVYAASSPDDPVTESNDALGYIAMVDQVSTFHIKNQSSLSTVEATNPIESPVHIEIFHLKLTEDLFNNDNSDPSHLTNEISQGFSQYYDGTTTPLSASQDLHVRFGENLFLKDKCELLEVKKFCLAAGQQATWKVAIPQLQVFSMKWLLEARYYNGTNYIPIVYKKGEHFFMMKFHGGLYGTSNPASGAHFASSKIAFNAYHTYNAAVWGIDNTSRTFIQDDPAAVTTWTEPPEPNELE